MYRTPTKTRRFLTGFLFAATLLILLAGSPHPRTVTAAGPLMVTNILDSGPGSLRQAITDANSTPGTDTINFAIGSGPQTITLLSVLPVIGDAVIIDATTQPGFAGAPIIQLNGASIAGPAIGLFITAGPSTVKGLIINRFNTDGIRLSTGNGNTITGNYLGTNAAGTAASPNLSYGIEINQSANNVVGGATASARNIISGNTLSGVFITGSASTGNTVLGNYIGTNASGVAAVANGGAGININAAAGNTIGGTTAGARNIISGNGAEGILITNSTAADTIQGNFIGTTVSGSAGLGNNSAGVSINGSNGTIIGGTAAGSGNVLSGNTGANSYGVQTQTSSNTQIQGNLIGTNAAGTAAIANDAGGIILLGGSSITIGGTSAAARNLISGNGGGGILILSDSTLVQGNFIGTNGAGTAALPNGSQGVLLNGSDNGTIGGTAAGAGNLISGNGNGGIVIAFSADNNTVQGNLIGTDASGTAALGNGTGFPGVLVQGTAINNMVGGTAAGAGNIIAFNNGSGVSVTTSSRSGVLGNSILSNAGLGIDLSPTGVTPNDACDADGGPNNLQNFPVLTSASAGATNTTVAGTLNSTANTTFRVEFFSNPACNAAGSGEGKKFLGFQSVTTDASCNASINFVVANASVSGTVITATATDPNNNTSEFSPCIQWTTSNAVLQFSSATYSVNEGGVSVTITVNRTANTAAVSTVDFITGNAEYRPCTPGDPQNIAGLASQNCDFVRTQGKLTFNPGDTSKTFAVLIVDDAHVEGAETFPITLSNPVGGTLGAIGTATVTITDNDTALTPSPAPFRFAGALSKDQETPPTNSLGFGQGMVLLSQDQASAKAGLLWSNLTSSQTVQHVHNGATGVAGPIIFTLPNGSSVINTQLNGITAQQVSDLKAGLLYMNTHTTNFPNGEIRAQLLWNPTLEENFFVNEQYFDFLQRQPDQGGFDYWTGQLSPCAADVLCFHDRTIGISNAFFYEQEYQQTGAYVYRLFRASFGNIQPQPNPDSSNPTEANKIPSYDAYSAVRALVIGGANLTAGQQDSANLFVNSPQFLAKYPANLPLDQFVDAVLATIMNDIGVNLTSQRTALIALGSRAGVLYRLANDDLPGGNGGINNRLFIDAEYNRAFVVTEYFGYLRRDGDIAGVLFWLGQVSGAPLRDTSKQNAMVCSFITSGEYQLRFGPKIPRTNKECPQ